VADLATNIADEVVFIAEARIIKHHVEEAPTGGRPTRADGRLIGRSRGSPRLR
jgi:hypothetical protein